MKNNCITGRISFSPGYLHGHLKSSAAEESTTRREVRVHIDKIF